MRKVVIFSIQLNIYDVNITIDGNMKTTHTTIYLIRSICTVILTITPRIPLEALAILTAKTENATNIVCKINSYVRTIIE